MKSTMTFKGPVRQTSETIELCWTLGCIEPKRLSR